MSRQQVSTVTRLWDKRSWVLFAAGKKEFLFSKRCRPAVGRPSRVSVFNGYRFFTPSGVMRPNVKYDHSNPLTSIHLHSLPFTSTHLHSLPFTSTHLHPPPFISTHLSSSPLTSVHLYSLPLTSIHLHSPALTSIYL